MVLRRLIPGTDPPPDFRAYEALVRETEEARTRNHSIDTLRKLQHEYEQLARSDTDPGPLMRRKYRAVAAALADVLAIREQEEIDRFVDDELRRHGIKAH